MTVLEYELISKGASYQNRCPHMEMTASLAVSKQILHSKLELSGASSSPPSAPPEALLLLSLWLLLLLGPAVAMLWTFLASDLKSWSNCLSHQKPEN